MANCDCEDNSEIVIRVAHSPSLLSEADSRKAGPSFSMSLRSQALFVSTDGVWCFSRLPRKHQLKTDASQPLNVLLPTDQAWPSPSHFPAPGIPETGNRVSGLFLTALFMGHSQPPRAESDSCSTRPRRRADWISPNGTIAAQESSACDGNVSVYRMVRRQVRSPPRGNGGVTGQWWSYGAMVRM